MRSVMVRCGGVVWCALAVLLASGPGTAVLAGTKPMSGAAEVTREGNSVAGVMAAFAAERRTAMTEAADREEIAVPSDYDELLTAIEAGDWPSAANRFEQIKVQMGQHKDGPSDSAAYKALWQYVLEAAGAFEQAALWTPELLHLYAEEVMGAIPPGAVYFGGTAAGRFVITAYRTVLNRPFHVIAQIELAEPSYMDFLRDTVGQELDLPSPEDCTRIVQRHVEEVQTGGMPAAPGVTIKDGRISASGIHGVMMINGILSQMIFDRNKAAHEFYVDESYVIPWMYPYLEPSGPIMRLRAQPRKLSPETIAEDRTYWDDLEGRLKQVPAFAESEAAQQTFSKLRSAVGGVYEYWRLRSEAEYAFQQALRLYPDSPEACFRYAQHLVQRELYEEAMDVLSAFLQRDPGNDTARGYLDHVRSLHELAPRRTAIEGVPPDEVPQEEAQ